MRVRTDVKAGMGLGDCVAKIAGVLGLDEAAKKYEQVTGENCGCKKRQEMLNKAVTNVPFT